MASRTYALGRFLFLQLVVAAGLDCCVQQIACAFCRYSVPMCHWKVTVTWA
jgi:hypothetical protein